MRELGAPIWGTKDILWDRLVKYERVAEGERALRPELAEEVALRREGRPAVAVQPIKHPETPTDEEVKQHELTCSREGVVQVLPDG